MTSVERTAYPRFRRKPSVKELRELYTPTLADINFVNQTSRGPAQKFALMILLKVYQRLGYFPRPETIPGVIIGHIRASMNLDAKLVPDIASNHTLYRYHKAIREHLEIQGEESTSDTSQHRLCTKPLRRWKTRLTSSVQRRKRWSKNTVSCQPLARWIEWLGAFVLW
jgi:hypothetical protein